MLAAIFNHLWQSTAFAAMAGLLTLALRKNHARVRHGLWLAASIKFLIPISFLISLGGAIPWNTAPQLVAKASQAVVLMDAVSQPFTWSVAHQPVERSPSTTEGILLAIWLCGFIGIGVSWYVRWRRIRAVVKAGSVVQLDLPVETIVCQGSVEPGVFGVFRPVLMLLYGLSERLTPTHLDAVIAHELCHLRHRDNFVAAIQMFVETVFWFHPLVWWIGKRMLEERERACDEEVLRTRCQPRAYADAILRVCRLYVESPLPCMAGVTGADLRRRIEEIMSNRTACGLNRGRKLLLAMACVLAVAAPLAIGLAQSESANSPAFEAVSVKLHPAGDRSGMTQPTALPGGRFVSRAPLMFLIGYAYKLPFNPSSRLTGLPDWVQPGIYDIEATSEMPPGLSVEARDDRVRAMVRAMLADRFKLVVRRESKEMPVYALVVAKGGPKLQRSDIDEKDCPEPSITPVPVATAPIPDVCHAFNGGRGRGLHARAVSMSDVAGFVENWTDRPLLDKTGIKGLYRIETKGWQAMDAIGPAAPGTTSGTADVPTVFEMFEGLGLRMEPQKGVTDVYVVDHIEKPSEN
jgi:bla regulator protein blaR1